MEMVIIVTILTNVQSTTRSQSRDMDVTVTHSVLTLLAATAAPVIPDSLGMESIVMV